MKPRYSLIKAGNNYRVVGAGIHKVIACKEANLIDSMFYLQHQYKKIFPNYKESEDEVEYDQVFKVFSHVKKERILTIKNCKPPSGFYSIIYGDKGSIELSPFDINMDSYIELQSSNLKILNKDINIFVKSKSFYDKLGLVYKRGALIYGEPGNGKTYQIIRNSKFILENNDGIVLIPAPDMDLCVLKQLQETFENRFVIFIIEELTERVNREIEDLLSFLDGEYSWNNCYTITTTNYPEKLSKNIVDRPGRFDLICEIENPNKEDRFIYLNNFVKEIDDFILEATEGFSIAYLKELVLQHYIYKIPLKESIKRFKSHKIKINKSFKKGSGVGFEN